MKFLIKLKTSKKCKKSQKLWHHPHSPPLKPPKIDFKLKSLSFHPLKKLSRALKFLGSSLSLKKGSSEFISPWAFMQQTDDACRWSRNWMKIYRSSRKFISFLFSLAYPTTRCCLEREIFAGIDFEREEEEKGYSGCWWSSSKGFTVIDNRNGILDVDNLAEKHYYCHSY